MIDFNDISISSHYLIVTEAKINEISWLWHRRLGHDSIHLIFNLIKGDLVKKL